MAPPRVESPCTLVCTLDHATGWCFGCGRTGAEIGDWPVATDDRRQQILDQLPERLASLRAR